VEFDRPVATGIEPPVDLEDILLIDRRQIPIPGDPCRIQGVEQDDLHVRRPGLLVVIDQGLQFPEQMRIAETVTHVFHCQIWWPTIVNNRSHQSRRDIAPSGAETKMAEGVGTENMQPARLAGNSEAGLVQMLHGNGRT